MFRSMFAALVLFGFISSASAAVITVVVPTNPGANIDVLARLLFSDLTYKGDTFIIENKFGANGDIGFRYALSIKNQGSKVVFFSFNGTWEFNPHNKPPVEFDRMRDSYFLAPVVGIQMTLVVKTDDPNITAKQAIEKLQSKPSAIGLNADAGDFLNSKFLNVVKPDVKVPYKTYGELVLALQRGDIDYTFAGYNAAFASAKGIKIVATTGETQIGDIPTFKQLGYDFMTYYVLSLIAVPPSDKEFWQDLQPILLEKLKTPQLKQILDSSEQEVLPYNSDKEIRGVLEKRSQEFGSFYNSK